MQVQLRIFHGRVLPYWGTGELAENFSLSVCLSSYIVGMASPHQV